MTKKQWGAKKTTARGRRALAARVQHLVAKYQMAMGLASWDIEVKFGQCKNKAIAQAAHDFRLREATLTFDLDRQMGRPAKFVEHDVIHELAHCFTARQDHLVRMLWEHVYQDVAEALAVDFERMPALTNRR